MKLIIFVPVLLCSFLCSYAQITIKGYLYSDQSQINLSGISVLLQNPIGNDIYSYTTTNREGKYILSYNGEADSLLLVIKGFNIKPIKKIILARPQTLHFNISYESLKLKEIQVNADPIHYHHDTITYNTASFSDPTDHSIGEVLQKMPGIEIEHNGGIKYNGRPINKFYIEGLDLLKGRYRIAMNNIAAKDIAQVEIYENHEPIKALKNTRITDQAAINLVLKNSAKRVFNAAVAIGGGYKPALWTGELVSTYFARKFQMLNTYKTNNTGENLSEELTSFYNRQNKPAPILTIESPITPLFDIKRYLTSDIHLLSYNSLRKINKNLELTTNGNYWHDHQLLKGRSTTTYYLPQTTPLIITEQNQVSQYTDQTDLNLELQSNTERIYFSEKFTFTGEWDHKAGILTHSSDLIQQKIYAQRINLKNDLQGIKRIRNILLNFHSTTSYSSQPEKLTVVPPLFPITSGNSPGTDHADQKLIIRRFQTHNQASAGFLMGPWTFFFQGTVHLQSEKLTSSLYSLQQNEEVPPIADSLSNDLHYQKTDISLSPGLHYNASDRFQFNLYVPLSYINLQLQNHITNRQSDLNRIRIIPYLHLQALLTSNLQFSFQASYNQNSGEIFDMYNGYIMSNYRTVSRKEGKIPETDIQYYSASFDYKNSIYSLFGSCSFGYWYSSANQMYGTEYEGDLSETKIYDLHNHAIGYQTCSRIGKYYTSLATTLTLSFEYSYTRRNLLRQTEIMQSTSRHIKSGLAFITRFSPYLRFDYEGTYQRTKSQINLKSNFLSPIHTVKQVAAVNLILSHKYIFKIAGEHYYNNSSQSNHRSCFFSDLSFFYNAHRVEYSVEARNILNTRSFYTISYADVTKYAYTSGIRPCSVLFKIKFNF